MLTPPSIVSRAIKVCHVAVADLWAGAEVHLVSLLMALSQQKDIEVSAVLFNEGPVAQELRTAGIDVLVVPESRYGIVKLVWILIRHFQEKGFDIIHAHKPKDSLVSGLACWLVGHGQLVRTLHGLWEPFTGIQKLKMKSYAYLDELANRYLVKLLVTVTEDIRGSLSRVYAANKMVCIHNGMDLDRIRIGVAGSVIRRELGILPNWIVIGTVGRLTPVKGHVHLLRAMQQILRRHGEIKLLIVGDGPLRTELERLARELSIEGSVIFCGHRSDVWDFIDALDVFVLPSLHEGIPMVLLEALALSKAVVASRVGGIPEVLEDGVSGLLVETGDSLQLARAIESLIEDPGKAKQLGIYGRARVQQHFTCQLMASRTVEVYRRLIDASCRKLLAVR